MESNNTPETTGNRTNGKPKGLSDSLTGGQKHTRKAGTRNRKPGWQNLAAVAIVGCLAAAGVGCGSTTTPAAPAASGTTPKPTTCAEHLNLTSAQKTEAVTRYIDTINQSSNSNLGTDTPELEANIDNACKTIPEQQVLLVVLAQLCIRNSTTTTNAPTTTDPAAGPLKMGELTNVAETNGVLTRAGGGTGGGRSSGGGSKSGGSSGGGSSGRSSSGGNNSSGGVTGGGGTDNGTSSGSSSTVSYTCS